jgi:hypothetical protein
MKQVGARTPILAVTYAAMVATTIAGTTAGLHLTFLTERTATTFAWHIRNPLTAAFFGAAYVAAGIALTATLLRAKRWEELRTAAILATAFISLAGLVTIRHLGEFQHDGDEPVARFVAWVWLVLYFGLPFALAASVVMQEMARRAGSYRPEQPLILGFRLLFAAAGALLGGFGIALLLNRQFAVDLWPWPVPPLSARVAGGWVLAMGLTQLWSAIENDWAKLRTYALATLGFFPLQVVAALRYAGRFDDGAPLGLYLAAVVLLFAMQVAACIVHLRRYG